MKRIASFVIIILLGLFSLSFSTKEKEMLHPYHVGSVEFNYNASSKTFEITGRFFIDDFENAINNKYGKNLHFQDTKLKSSMDEAIKKYASEYLKLKVNGQFVNIHYIGFEEDSESVEIYLETAKVEQPKKIETAVSFLYNIYDDQANIIHVIVNKERKTSKVTYPNRYLYQQF